MLDVPNQFIQTQPVTGVDRGSDWNGGKCAGFRGGAGAGGAFDLTSMRTEGLPALLMLLRMEFARDSVRGRANGWRALPPSGQALAMASMDDAVPTMRSYVATDERTPCLLCWALSATAVQMRKHHGSRVVAAEAKRGRTNDLCVRRSTDTVGGMARMPTARLFDFNREQMIG